MKVLFINGSPHPNGCTNTALLEVAKTFSQGMMFLGAGDPGQG